MVFIGNIQDMDEAVANVGSESLEHLPLMLRLHHEDEIRPGNV